MIKQPKSFIVQQYSSIVGMYTVLKFKVQTYNKSIIKRRPTTKQKKKLIFATWVAVSFPTVFSKDSSSFTVGYDMRDNLASNAWLDGSCRISMILLNLTRDFLGA